MWHTLLGLAPITALALILAAWTTVDIARSGRSPRDDIRGDFRG
jgi:hypothetical protein